MTAGYSGTPLTKKLGMKPGHIIAIVDEPDNLRELLVDVPPSTTFSTELGENPDIVLGFFTAKVDLEQRLDDLAEAVFPDRVIWLAWPKKTSGVETDLTGDVVRAAVLSTKLVDIKVCAISDIWSGLKVMWRKEHR